MANRTGRSATSKTIGVAWATTASLMALVAGPAVADGLPTDPFVTLPVGPDPYLALPTVPTLNPHLTTSTSFDINGCEGNKEKIKAVQVTGVVGGGELGPAWMAFLAIMYTEQSQGWAWSIQCNVNVNWVSATGWGSVFREVSIVSDVYFQGAVQAELQSEANCFYDGVVELAGCTARIPAEGQPALSYALTLSGHTWGYPQDGQVAIRAHAQNTPMYNVNTPAGPLFQTATLKYADSDSDSICWKDCSNALSNTLASNVLDLVPVDL